MTDVVDEKQPEELTPDLDTLDLNNNEEFKEMMQAKLKVPETVYYSRIEVKINQRHSKQNRALAITDRAIYNFKSGTYSYFKRRIAIRNLMGVTISLRSDEFVLHVPDEYDYRYSSTNRTTLLRVLGAVYRQLTRHQLLVQESVQANLADYTLTIEMKLKLTRNQLNMIKSSLLLERHQSDDEEVKEIATERTSMSVLVEAKMDTPLLAAESKSTGGRSGTADGSSFLSIEDFEFIHALRRFPTGKSLCVRRKSGPATEYQMKIFRKDRLEQSEKDLERVLRQRSLLEEIHHHPFIVGLVCAFQSEKKLYLVLDFPKGGEMYEHLRTVGSFSEVQSRLFGAEVALALGHLHNLGIVYKDLRPENLLLEESGSHVYLTEAEDVEEAKTNVVEYMAPELLDDDPTKCSIASDWWSFGVLLYEMVCGVSPFYDASIEEMRRKIKAGEVNFSSRVSNEFRDLVLQLLVNDPMMRLGSQDDANDVKKHPFFAELDWETVMRKEVPSGYSARLARNVSTKSLVASGSSAGLQLIDDGDPEGAIPNDRFAKWGFAPSDEKI